MSMTPDAGSYFQPLNYTTSFTNPAGYNYGSLQNTFNQGQQGFDASIRDIEYTQKLFQHYYEQSLFGVANSGMPAPPGTYGEGGLDPGGSQGLGYPSFRAPWNMPSGGSGGGAAPLASPYQTTPNVFETGASPFIGAGGSSGLGGSMYQNMPSIDWGNIGKAAAGLQAPSKSPFDFNAGMGGSMFGGLGGAGASPGAGLDWTKLYPGGGARTDPYPNMAMPGGLNQPMVTPQQQPQDFGSLFGRGVGGMAGAPNTPQPAAPSFDVSSKVAQPSLTDYGATPSLDFTKLFGGSATAAPTTAPSTPQQATPQPQAIPQTTPQTGSEAGSASFNDRFSAAPASTTLPPPAAGAVPSGALGAETTPEQLIQQSRSRLAGLLAPYDQPSLEQFRKGTPAVAETTPLPEARPTEAPNPLEAIKEALPGEAGRGGMVGRAAEPAIEWKDGVPVPRERPAEADSPATDIYPGKNPPRPPANVPVTVEPGQEASARGINQRLRTAVEGGAQFLPPGYSVEIHSGERFDSPTHKQAYHKGGNAMDIRIRGPDGLIRDRGADESGMYTLLARGVKTWAAQNDPSFLQQGKGGLGWGGAFETSTGSGTSDLMHFDRGGSRGQLSPQAQFGGLQPLSEAEKNMMPAYIPLLGANQAPFEGRVPTGAGSAYKAYPTRFGGEFGGDEFSGQLPSAGAFTPYPGWREGGRFEDRTAEQINRDDLAALQARGTGYPVGREVPPTPLGMDLGLGDLQRQAARPAAAPGGSLADRYQAGTLADAGLGTYLAPWGKDLPALKQQLGEPPDINRMPVSTSDKIINSLGGAAIRGALAPGNALSSGQPLTSEDLLKPAQDMSTGYLAGAPFKEAMKNAAQTVWDTMKPVKTTTDWLWPDTSAQPPGISGRAATFDERFSGEPSRFDSSIFDPGTYGDIDPGAGYALGRSALARMAAAELPAGEIEGEAGRGGMTGRAALAAAVQSPNDRYAQYSDEMPPNMTPSRFAAARTNNPGAMYPGGIATKYGGTAGVTGQTSPSGGKYKIAIFDTPIAGAAANFENLSQHYAGMKVGDAIRKWSGNLRGTVPGYPSDTVITQDMIQNPDFAIPFLKAVAAGEAPGNVAMSARDWRQAHDMFTGKYPGD